MTSASCQLIANDRASPAASRTTPPTYPSDTGTMPAAIGRNLFLTWTRSASTSRASLMK
jgi:hypothetical protein